MGSKTVELKLRVLGTGIWRRCSCFAAAAVVIRLFLAFLPLTPPPKKKEKKTKKTSSTTKKSSNCCCCSKQAIKQQIRDAKTSSKSMCHLQRLLLPLRVRVCAYVAAAAASADCRSVRGEKASIENSIGNTGTGTGCFVNQSRTEWGTRLGTGTGTEFLVNQLSTELGTRLGTRYRNGLFREPIQNKIGNRYRNGFFSESIQNSIGNKIGNRNRNGISRQPIEYRIGNKIGNKIQERTFS